MFTEPLLVGLFFNRGNESGRILLYSYESYCWTKVSSWSSCTPSADDERAHQLLAELLAELDQALLVWRPCS